MSLETFPIVRCSECALAYVNPRPDAEHLPEYYATGYFGARHPIFKKQLMALRTLECGRPAPGARLLDIGCGSGDFILACQARGWQVVGAEQASAPILRHAHELGLEVIAVEDLASLPDGSFDMITLWHVFEHLADPVAVLREAHRLLKVGGRLLIEVPNFGGWHGRIGGAAWHHLDVPRHLTHFDRRTLEHMLVGQQLVPERWSTFSIEYDAFGMLQTALNGVCRAPNHLYQLLIRQPMGGTARDTFLTALFVIPFGIAAGLFTLIAALCGQGGVLRTVARKRAA
jgi:SAM-dependent methyltransferase